jgi:hypothetical protein
MIGLVGYRVYKDTVTRVEGTRGSVLGVRVYKDTVTCTRLYQGTVLGS